MRRAYWLFVFAAGLAVVCWAIYRPKFAHDPPRDFPWQVPDYRAAKYAHHTLPDGRIRLEISHLPLHGITPDMLAWWYRELPVSQVSINGESYPFYHLFHLTEHGQIRLLEPAADGKPGMGVGALVSRREWFGSYESSGAARVMALSNQGMLVHPEAAGLWFGEIRHRFEAVPGGSRYALQSTIGVDWPVVGPAVNAWLRRTRFPEAMLLQWQRHQIEEVAMLNYFLPELYAQRGHGSYRLELSKPADD